MSISRRTFAVSTVAAATAALVPAAAVTAAHAAGPVETGHAWRFAFTASDGSPLPLEAFRGKVLLIVNTASRCGYTSQYRGLQALYEAHGSAGLVVIGVPSNDFGGQEPGTDADIRGFCGGTFGVTFPLAAKSVVRGPGAHPFYRWASTVLGPASEPRWNFHKYLISRDGRLDRAFPSHVEPEDPRVVAAIRTALDGPAT
ncbi:glutathione peroxidase [Prosthecomicrobium hirschii]|uniref:glutathione peroxidase n=1 Tax=Prosthecodimorpha hirschii TaxID=665126 RepID=UPI002220A915|nr:glutathione peroxidase [Prosthecomicrobium hirschii]MCW1839524.1 glutathione peroxidase [Prosthecomicrobium hirschii]